MRVNARLTKRTKTDLLAAIVYFEGLSNGLGDRFEGEFYLALERVKLNPEQFATDGTGFRPCPLKRFTGVMYFRIIGDEAVVFGLFVNGQDETDLKYR